MILGGCGSGLTSVLLRVNDLLEPDICQYIDAERITTTPEGFLRTITTTSPYRSETHTKGVSYGSSTRETYSKILSFLSNARPTETLPATFLIDDILEFKTFENFPGLRDVLQNFLKAVSLSANRFVLTTRYVTRAHRLLGNSSSQFEVIHLPPLTPLEVTKTLSTYGLQSGPQLDELGRTVQTLTDGRPSYVRALTESMLAINQYDPVSALAAQLGPGGQLYSICRFCYELRLHRARGHGALKAILKILSEAEPLTLTEISQRLRRTPGSTRDYLSWLEDVDLVTVRQKRYSFTDPVLGLWVRIHCRPMPPKEADLALEIQNYALARLPYIEPSVEPVAQSENAETLALDVQKDKSWRMIEID